MDLVFPEYAYLYVPAVPPIVSPCMVYVSATPTQSVEAELRFRAVPAETIRLSSGDRAYRIPFADLPGLKQDSKGRFVGERPKYYATVGTDPTAGLRVVGDWTPI